jgi:ribonuclease HI
MGNQNVDASTPASWGMVVVVGDSGLGKGSGELHHEAAGPVVTERQAEGFIGAEVGSNNTAELSGFAAALRWLLVEGGDEPAMIRADSTYAGNLAAGVWPRQTGNWWRTSKPCGTRSKRFDRWLGRTSKHIEATGGTNAPTTLLRAT